MPKPNTAVLVLPMFEETVRYASEGVESAVSDVRGWDFVSLVGSLASKESFREAVGTADPSFIVGVGHGLPYEFTGDDKQVIMRVGDDVSYLKGRVVYLLSCYTGQELGRYLVERGARSFIGYTHPFMFVVKGSSDPLSDAYGKYFFEPVNALLDTLLTGGSVGEAINRSRLVYNSLIDSLGASGWDYAPSLMAFLINDRDGLVGYGDMNATVGSGSIIRTSTTSQYAPLLASVVTYALTGNPVYSILAGVLVKALRGRASS